MPTIGLEPTRYVVKLQSNLSLLFSIQLLPWMLSPNLFRGCIGGLIYRMTATDCSTNINQERAATIQVVAQGVCDGAPQNAMYETMICKLKNTEHASVTELPLERSELYKLV